MSKRLQIVIQTPKIKLLRVTEGVRPYSPISKISNKIQQLLGRKFMSKNVLCNKLSYKILRGFGKIDICRSPEPSKIQIV